MANAAATERLQVSAGFDRTVPVRDTGNGADYRPLSVQFFDVTGNTLRGVKVSVDGSGLHGFAELDLPTGCAYTSADHLHESCALGDVRGGSGRLAVGVRALTAARAGQTGSVAFKVTAANGTDASAQSVGVTVGDGPDLVVNDLGSSFKVTPGGTAALPLRFANAGSRDGKGIVVFVHDQFGNAEVPGNYSNCLYEHSGNGQRGAYCTFPDADIEPGQQLQLSDPFTISTPAGAHSDEIQYGAGLTGDDWVGSPEGTAGTGGELRLVPVPAANSKKMYDPSIDIDTQNNLYYTQLDTGTVTDVAGVDRSLDAVIGRPSAITFEARNSGTTTISGYSENVGGSVGAYLEFPSSVQVKDVPKDCRTALGSPEELSAYPQGKKPVLYYCVRTVTLEPGQTTGFTFQIVPLTAESGQYAGMYVFASEDQTADQRNNSAHVAIDATTAAASPTPTATATANTPSGDGDQGGELAATGSGAATLWTAVGGCVVLAAGAAALIGTRRRSSARRG
ncbi:hypothetical protein [Streptomyces sp. NBC_01198]|uniref:hypothetical protein n=1 Tax=Streptomyces sp. NBC_01198 TaxID=2903769 RepID=UPI002E0E2202|nr:hypothetical protein OG702_16520 [Streptomyces sp. NBC_01198]